MKSYSSRKIIQILEQNNWYRVSTRGDHWKFKHPTIEHTIVITHPVKDVSIGILKDIIKKSGLNF